MTDWRDLEFQGLKNTMAAPIDMMERDERAADAKELLDNPLLQEVFKRIEAEAQEAMLGAEPGSPVATANHHRIMAIRAIHADLLRLVDDPKMLRAAAERRRRFSQ
jgi:hypothetical protein